MKEISILSNSWNLPLDGCRPTIVEGDSYRLIVTKSDIVILTWGVSQGFYRKKCTVVQDYRLQKSYGRPLPWGLSLYRGKHAHHRLAECCTRDCWQFFRLQMRPWPRTDILEVNLASSSSFNRGKHLDWLVNRVPWVQNWVSKILMNNRDQASQAWWAGRTSAADPYIFWKYDIFNLSTYKWLISTEHCNTNWKITYIRDN